jgi:hypothetical protein
VRRTVGHYRELQDVISLLGVEEPGVDDRRVVARSRTSVASPSALADHLTATLYDRLGAHRAAGVTLVHAVPAPSASLDIVTHSLLPFDFARFSAASNRNPPLVTIAPARLIARLAQEYVFAQLCEAIILSFAVPRAKHACAR